VISYQFAATMGSFSICFLDFGFRRTLGRPERRFFFCSSRPIEISMGDFSRKNLSVDENDIDFGRDLTKGAQNYSQPCGNAPESRGPGPGCLHPFVLSFRLSFDIPTCLDRVHLFRIMFLRRTIVSTTFIFLFIFQIWAVIAETSHDVGVSDFSAITIEEKLQVRVDHTNL